MASPAKLKVGRASGNDIVVDHPTVSRLHLEITRNDDGSLDIFDKGSAVGTFVLHDGAWVQFEHATVGPDETIRLGDFETTPALLLAGYRDPFDAVTQRGSCTPRTQRPAKPTRTGEAAGQPDPKPVPRSRPGSDGRSEPKITRSRRTAKPRTSPSESATESVQAAPEPQTVTPAPATPQATPVPPVPPESATPDATEAAAIASVAGPPSSKTTLVAYALWFFLGVFGAHRFYLGATITAILQLALSLVSVAVSFWNLFVGVAPLVLVVIWWIVDGFLTNDMLKKLNGRGNGASPPPPNTA